MSKRLLRNVLPMLACLLLPANLALAQEVSALQSTADEGWYVGFNLASTRMNGAETFNGTSSTDPIDGSPMSANVIVGRHILQKLKLELSYMDLGTGHDKDSEPESFTAKGAALSAVMPFEISSRARLLLRGGLHRWRFEESRVSDPETQVARGTSHLLGAGVEVAGPGYWRIRAELVRYFDIGEGGSGNPGEVDIDSLWLGVTRRI